MLYLTYGHFVHICFEHIPLSLFAVIMVFGDEFEYRLVRDLMVKYDKRIRPSKNASDALNVTFGLALAQIIDVVSSLSFIYLLVYLFTNLFIYFFYYFLLIHFLIDVLRVGQHYCGKKPDCVSK